MAIKIKVEKVVKQGEQFFKILEVVGCLHHDEVPHKYLYNKTSYCFLTEKTVQITDKEGISYLTTHCIYSKDVFYSRIEKIRKCGEILHKINKELAEKNRDWEGEEMYII